MLKSGNEVKLMIRIAKFLPFISFFWEKFFDANFSGSLPVNEDIKVSITSFGLIPKLEHKFSDPQDRDSLFERIESIQPIKGQVSYAKAVQSALEYYKNHKRSDAKGVLLIVGDGENDDKKEDRNLAANTIRKVGFF